jgi:glucuronyl/N-acetylglucosaminyl transferase EXT2
MIRLRPHNSSGSNASSATSTNHYHTADDGAMTSDDPPIVNHHHNNSTNNLPHLKKRRRQVRQRSISSTWTLVRETLLRHCCGWYRNHVVVVYVFGFVTIIGIILIGVRIRPMRTALSLHRRQHNTDKRSSNSNHLRMEINTAYDRFNMKDYLQQPHHRLQDIDYRYYTIRINTWERVEQLQLSVQHHLSCPLVLQIQIVWCIHQSIPIPDWLLVLERVTKPILYETTSYPRIVIERHEINSLNERFHPVQVQASITVPTAAVLSIDDDVIRPCIALDYTFYMWMQNPDRHIGFDARSHDIVHNVDDVTTIITTAHDAEIQHPYHHSHHHTHHHSSHLSNTTTTLRPQWKYSYMSVTEKTNLYSLTLTRFSFFHRHYMTLYMNEMASEIRNTVTTNMNCEDIAMSLMISSYCPNTIASDEIRPQQQQEKQQYEEYKVPLLANLWAVKSQIKLYVAQKISGTNNHKSIRDECVHNFSQRLHLQIPLAVMSDNDENSNSPFHTVPLHLGSYFEYGDTPENWNRPNLPNPLSTELEGTVRMIERWKQTTDRDVWMNEMKLYRDAAVQPIYDAGYIEKTIPWKRKFQQ